MGPDQAGDLMVFLAVAQAGTVAEAARVLGVDASTVSRRVSRLEESLGATLFDRSGRGMKLAERGQQLRGRVQQGMNHLSLGIDEVKSTPEALSGPVVVAAPTQVGAVFVVPTLPALLAQHPHIEVVLTLGTRFVELEQREADIALRTRRPTQGDVVTRRLGGLPVRPHRHPDVPETEARRRWVAFIGSDPLVERWSATVPDARVVLRSNDLAGLTAACEAGLGTAVLPERAGERCGLVPLSSFEAVAGTPLWIAAPRTCLELPRVRAVWEHLVEAFEEVQ